MHLPLSEMAGRFCLQDPIKPNDPHPHPPHHSCYEHSTIDSKTQMSLLLPFLFVASSSFNKSDCHDSLRISASRQSLEGLLCLPSWLHHRSLFSVVRAARPSVWNLDSSSSGRMLLVRDQQLRKYQAPWCCLWAISRSVTCWRPKGTFDRKVWSSRSPRRV